MTMLADIFLSHGANAGDATVLANTNLIGPLRLRVPLHLYNKNLSSLYVSIKDAKLVCMHADVNSPILQFLAHLAARTYIMTLNSYEVLLWYTECC